MIDRAYISEWQQTAPWPQRYQVEQDLIICRALVDIFNHPLISCFLKYMELEGHRVSRAEFEKNLSEKFKDSSFLEDIGPLLMKNSGWDINNAKDFVLNSLVVCLPGDAWQGK